MGAERKSSSNKHRRKCNHSPSSSSSSNSVVVVLVTAALTWSFSSVIILRNGCQEISMVPILSLAGSKLDFTQHESPNKTNYVESTDAILFNTTVKGPVPSRVWTKFEPGFPCFPGETTLMKTTPAHKGFLFQRPTKVGSTSLVGVVLRLVHNKSPWLENATTILQKQRGVKCLHRSMHGSALSYEYNKRDTKQSFLLSLLRHPTKRAISEFFHFWVSVHQEDPTDPNFLHALGSPKMAHNKYLMDLTLRNYTESMNRVDLMESFRKEHGFTSTYHLDQTLTATTSPGRSNWDRKLRQYMYFGPHMNKTKVVEEILDGYNFIAVMERMDDSLVVLQMLLGLSTKDILYTKARSSGSFSNGPPGRPCIYIPKAFLTPGMKKYFASTNWNDDIIAGDLLLYKAAVASLDRTMEALGKAEFQRNMEKFQAALKLAEQNCKGRVFPMCTVDGGRAIPATKRSCYIWGEACDHDCIDELNIP